MPCTVKNYLQCMVIISSFQFNPYSSGLCYRTYISNNWRSCSYTVYNLNFCRWMRQLSFLSPQCPSHCTCRDHLGVTIQPRICSLSRRSDFHILVQTLIAWRTSAEQFVWSLNLLLSKGIRKNMISEACLFQHW